MHGKKESEKTGEDAPELEETPVGIAIGFEQFRVGEALGMRGGKGVCEETVKSIGGERATVIEVVQRLRPRVPGRCCS